MATTATLMAEKLGISRSYLYYLKDKEKFDIRYDKNGKIIWDEQVFLQLTDLLHDKQSQKGLTTEVDPVDTIKIQNRRFLGNKYKLLSFIRETVDNNCCGVEVVADIFSGTGSVASAFLDKKIITNDNMYSNYICHVAWFGNQEYSFQKVHDMIAYYNRVQVNADNYMSLVFADTYFSKEDCKRIGFIREDIEKQFSTGAINERERALLITSLLYAMDRIANTCGHYDAYRKGSVFERGLKLSMPIPEETKNLNNACYNMDANELVKSITADLVYIDPPYNSRQYCDAYHLLENIAKWEKPEVKGVAKKMNRESLKSDYCTKKAPLVFEDLIKSINAKYILLSYNNMAVKGNDRSNAKISDEDIFRILKEKGDVQVFSFEYRAFTTGKSDIKGHEERLFLCHCKDYRKEIVASPFNYTGGKYKILDQMLPLFPKKVDKLVDLFCGGCDVGINASSNNVLFNDSNKHLIGMMNAFLELGKDKVFDEINGLIDKYDLSKSWENGYSFYNCESSKGLAEYNKKRFLNLRNDFNNYDVQDNYYYIMLFTLIVYSFNNQMRFNRKGKFNLPVGKRDFNPKMQKKLSVFIDVIKSGNYVFTSKDFRQVDFTDLTSNSLVYVDPPYLITCATYNEQNGWNENNEADLYNLLDELNNNGIRFAFSNVLSSNGKENHMLREWVDNSRYVIHFLDRNYSNSSYHKKDRKSSSQEVLITNY